MLRAEFVFRSWSGARFPLGGPRGATNNADDYNELRRKRPFEFRRFERLLFRAQEAVPR